MERSAWHDDPVANDGWVDLKPHDAGYDPAYASDQVALKDRPTKGDDIARSTMVYFGAQVGWSPDRESMSAGLEVIDDATNQPSLIAVCPVCGNDAAGNHGIRLERGEVCAGCLGYGEDHRIPALLGRNPST